MFSEFIHGLLLGLLIALTAMIVENEAWKETVIQHGYMQHNPTTGKVEWK